MSPQHPARLKSSKRFVGLAAQGCLLWVLVGGWTSAPPETIHHPSTPDATTGSICVLDPAGQRGNRRSALPHGINSIHHLAITRDR